jgi:hypothetical protein
MASLLSVAEVDEHLNAIIGYPCSPLLGGFTVPSAPPSSPLTAFEACMVNLLSVAELDDQLNALNVRPSSPPLPLARTIPLHYLPVVIEEEETEAFPPAYTANVDAPSSEPEGKAVISRESWYWLFYLILCGLWAGRHIMWAHLTGRPLAPRRKLSTWKTSVVVYLWKASFVFIVQFILKVLLLVPIIWVGQRTGLVTVTRDGKLRGPRSIVRASL